MQSLNWLNSFQTSLRRSIRVTISVCVAISVYSAHAKTRVMLDLSLARLFTNDFNCSIANNYYENQSTSKLSKNTERWTSNMVRNINVLDVWTVCNFILASCEAYLVLI